MLDKTVQKRCNEHQNNPPPPFDSDCDAVLDKVVVTPDSDDSSGLGTTLLNVNICSFWKHVKAMKSSEPSTSPVVDGFSNDSDITKNLSPKLANLLNSIDPSHRNALF